MCSCDWSSDVCSSDLKGAEVLVICKHSRVSMFWLPAKIAQQHTRDWTKQYPPDPSFPINPPTIFPKELPKHSPASLRALFQLQSATTPTDPYPSNPPRRCSCGQDRTPQHVLLSCPNYREARNDTLPLTRPGIEFDITQTPHIITFLR